MEILFADNIGGTAVEFKNGVLSVRAPFALAPGSPVRLRLMSEPPLELEGRTVTARRDDDSWFAVDVRLVNLRREARQFLEASLSNAPSTALRTES